MSAKFGALSAINDEAVSVHADEARFTELFRAHFGLVLAYARRRCASAEAAEDAAIDTFMVAWRRLSDVPADEPLPFLYGVARNQVLNQVRGARRRGALVELLGREVLAGLGPMDDVAARPVGPVAGELVAALKRLHAEEREALLLVAWEELTQEQAAAALRISRSAFARLFRRAQRSLATQLDMHVGRVGTTDAIGETHG